MINNILSYAFLQNAIMSIVMVSIICGIIGSIIVEKKAVMLSGGIAHISFAGIGLGFFLGIEPIIPALIVAVLATFVISIINRRTDTNTDSVIGIFWSFGMALGIFFAFFSKGYNPDMLSYLFGDVLTISRFYLNLEVVITLANIILVTAMYEYIKPYLFDETHFEIRVSKNSLMEILLNVMIAVSIVILIKVVGIILIIAMLTIPVTIAKKYINDFKYVMIASAIISIVLSFAGLYISYILDVPASATIIIVMSVVYFATIVFRRRK
ncbi:MAG: metal ABC transporter permease [Clostridia bacterium]|nr:metal ABC transporter permease [Clostridia bacterium]